MRNASVVEQALALMLACARKVIPGHRAVVQATYREMNLEPIQTTQWNFQGNWARIEGVIELFGATAGVVGMGDIGMEIARRCRVSGMEVYCYQRTPHPKEVEAALEGSYLPLDGLLAVSDYVVLVIPHTPESEGLTAAEHLVLMKPSATLMNVGQGGLVDEALIEALRSSRIAMAGLDVYRMEPLPASSPLCELHSVVLLPHTGAGLSLHWNVDIPASLGNIRRFFHGESTGGIVN